MPSDKPNCIIDPQVGIIHVSTGRKPLAEVIKELYENHLEINMDEVIHEVHDPDKEIRSLIDRINADHDKLVSGDWLQVKSGNGKLKNNICRKTKRR